MTTGTPDKVGFTMEVKGDDVTDVRGFGLSGVRADLSKDGKGGFALNVSGTIANSPDAALQARIAQLEAELKLERAMAPLNIKDARQEEQIKAKDALIHQLRQQLEAEQKRPPVIIHRRRPSFWILLGILIALLLMLWALLGGWTPLGPMTFAGFPPAVVQQAAPSPTAASSVISNTNLFSPTVSVPPRLYRSVSVDNPEGNYAIVNGENNRTITNNSGVIGDGNAVLAIGRIDNLSVTVPETITLQLASQQAEIDNLRQQLAAAQAEAAGFWVHLLNEDTWPAYQKELELVRVPTDYQPGLLRYTASNGQPALLKFHDNSVYDGMGNSPQVGDKLFVERFDQAYNDLILRVYLTDDITRAMAHP